MRNSIFLGFIVEESGSRSLFRYRKEAGFDTQNRMRKVITLSEITIMCIERNLDIHGYKVYNKDERYRFEKGVGVGVHV